MTASADDTVFALDIGTRNVMGLVARRVGEGIEVLGVAVVPHEERAMRDGQIHDIPKVARAVAKAKATLESELGFALRACAIAAAGRALQTHRARASQEVGLDTVIDRNRLRNLEVAAIQDAVGSLRGDESHCVGYSIVHYFLDGQRIANLEGQRGKLIEVELIATFLPRVVTDSLVAVCHASGLEVLNLTLEPIAAINAAVPANMRALNLALVDVGAGTSDVALTEGGTVIAYAMVPVAGDALTEAIAEAYLLDFMEAERVKHALAGDGAVRFTDVLGMEHTFAAEAIRQTVRPALDRLVGQVADSIRELNGKAPAAIILVGGGSLFPAVGPMLAQALSLPEGRVAVRGTEMIKRVERLPEALKGPMGVTPVGIALAALEQPGFRFLTVYVDDKVVTLEDWGSTRVLEALMGAGLDPNELNRKQSQLVTVTVNGEAKQYPGAPGAVTKFLLDGVPTAPDAPLHDGARVQVLRPQPGAEDAPLKVSDIVDLRPVPVTVNGLSMDFPPLVKVNGLAIMGDRRLDDGDILTVDRSVKALMVQAGLAEQPEARLHYVLDGEPQSYLLRQVQVRLDDRAADLGSEVRGGEVVEATQRIFPHPRVRDVLPTEALALDVRVNDRSVRVPNPALEVQLNGEAADLDAPLAEGAQLRRQLTRRLCVGDILPLLEDELGTDLDEVLVEVDGKFADTSTAIAATSVIEILTDEAGEPDEEKAPGASVG